MEFTLCLTGKGPLSCQNYQTNKSTLSITTTTIHSTHIYPTAGIKINTAGYSAYYLDSDCPSSFFCMVVDGSGFATSFNGTSWSAPINIAST